MAVSKIIAAADAVTAIRSGDVVASSGWGGHGVAEAVLTAIEDRFTTTGEPSDLTLVWAGGQGDGAGRGLDHLAHPGLIRRAVGGHYGLIPQMAKLAVEEQIEAYNLPEGVLVQRLPVYCAGPPILGIVPSKRNHLRTSVLRWSPRERSRFFPETAHGRTRPDSRWPEAGPRPRDPA